MDADEKNRLLFDRPHWKILLNPDQTYLGRCLVILKRPCGDLAEVTEDEIIEFLGIVKKIESSTPR